MEGKIALAPLLCIVQSSNNGEALVQVGQQDLEYLGKPLNYHMLSPAKHNLPDHIPGHKANIAT